MLSSLNFVKNRTLQYKTFRQNLRIIPPCGTRSHCPLPVPAYLWQSLLRIHRYSCILLTHRSLRFFHSLPQSGCPVSLTVRHSCPASSLFDIIAMNKTLTSKVMLSMAVLLCGLFLFLLFFFIFLLPDSLCGLSFI